MRTARSPRICEHWEQWELWGRSLRGVGPAGDTPSGWDTNKAQKEAPAAISKDRQPHFPAGVLDEMRLMLLSGLRPGGSAAGWKTWPGSG